MTLAIEKEAPPLQMDDTGTIRVSGTRVSLDTLIGWYKNGWTAELIARNYPNITLADVYATIGYYLRHTQVVEQYLDERNRQAEALRREIESQPGYQDKRKELVTRLKAKAKERGMVQ